MLIASTSKRLQNISKQAFISPPPTCIDLNSPDGHKAKPSKSLTDKSLFCLSIQKLERMPCPHVISAAMAGHDDVNSEAVILVLGYLVSFHLISLLLWALPWVWLSTDVI